MKKVNIIQNMTILLSHIVMEDLNGIKMESFIGKMAQPTYTGATQSIIIDME